MTDNQSRSLTRRERKIIMLYGSCDLIMTPQDFYSKWPVTQSDIAFVCRKSSSTVNRWLSLASPKQPRFNDQYHLALTDFLLEYYEQIPEQLKEVLFRNCSS